MNDTQRMTMNSNAGLPGGDQAQALSDFFVRYPGGTGRAMLWSWLKITMKGSFHLLDEPEQVRFIEFFDSLNEILLISPPE